MSKRFFTFLVILMGLSILGVIAVQLVWMKNAIQVKNELFDRSVNEALNQTAQEIERRQDIKVITGFPALSETQWATTPPVLPPKAPKNPVKIIKEYKKPSNFRFEVEVKNDHDDDVEVYAFASVDKDFEHEVRITHKDTIHTTTDIILSSSEFHLDSIEKLIDSIVGISPIEIIPDIQERVQLKTKKLRNLTRQVVSEISTVDRDNLDLEEIKETVQSELDNRNITINFEFAVLDDDTIQAISNATDSLKLANSLYQIRLFPDAIFNQNKKLALFFPGQNRYIYRSVSWLLFASFIFSMIILFTFALSIFFILRQKKISEMKSDFINNMTHEFKTPIATISVAADSISNKKVIGNPEQVNYFVGMIKKENTRMNRQVEDILTIAGLDKKDFEFHWETVNIHQLIEDAIQSIILQVERRGGQVQNKMNATNPMVTTDKNHCANLIYNLLDNANKYSPDKPQLSVETRNTSNGVIIYVSDKGVGMSKQVQSRIFERFYRQSSGNIHNVKGFGLGLSYVKAVLEVNQGNIRVQSEVGKGSRFEVFLPYMRM